MYEAVNRKAGPRGYEFENKFKIIIFATPTMVAWSFSLKLLDINDFIFQDAAAEG